MERTIAFKEQLSDAVSPVNRLISMMPVASAVVCADETLSIASANAGFYSLLHTTPSQKLQFFNADEADCMRLYKEFLRPAGEGSVFDTEFHYSYGGGNGIWIRLWATLYGQVEDVDLYLCCFLDITAEKERDAAGEFLSAGAVSFLKKMVGSGKNIGIEENHENPWRKFAEEETRLTLENCKLKEEVRAVKEENNDRYLCDLSCKKTGTCSMTMEKKEIYCRQLHDAMNMKERFKHDKLTGAWRREYFFDVVNRRLKESNATFQIVALDLDKFKYINEYYGRGAGDTVLKVIAERLLISFGRNAAIAHSYADKFYVCVQKEGFTQEEIDYIVYDKIALESGEVIKVSIKMGIFPYDASAKMYSADECVDRALMARSTIKGQHGKHYSIYTAELEERMNEENEIEDMMERALEQREYVVYYQPKFSLSTGDLVGAEALVRWNSPSKGLISPGKFVPLFERNGFIVKLDFYVYHEVCRFLRKQLDEGMDIVPISINVSRAHIETPDFVDKLISVVNRYGIPHEYLEIEMTESTYGAEDSNVIRIVNQLKEHGFSLSMDDFGSGYSSLNLLKDMPIDVLKIDKGFLEEVETSKRSREIIRMIVEMSKAINIRTICEGVETDQQTQFLRRIGCDMVQGFLFARPMPEENYVKIVMENKAANEV